VLFRAKKIALCGGSSIAITGADGSGKSTLSAALAEFGAGKGIVTFHYGLPSLTVIDRLKNRLLLRRALDSSSKEKKKSLASEKANESLFRKIYHVDLAYRRWRTAAVAKLLTHWGYVVVFDRYLNVNGGIDGPDLKSISGFLQGAEKFFYRNTHPVDLVIRLDYSTDVLVKRNRERNKEFKESDSEIIQRANKFADTTYLGKRELRVTDPNLDCDTLVEATLLELFGAKKNV
jgi:thymidylate kinase